MLPRETNWQEKGEQTSLKATGEWGEVTQCLKQGYPGKGKHLDFGIMPTTPQTLRGFLAEKFLGKDVVRIQVWAIRQVQGRTVGTVGRDWG